MPLASPDSPKNAILPLLLASTRPFNSDLISKIKTFLGGSDHLFLRNTDNWSAVTGGEQYDVRGHYQARITWQGQEKVVPATILALSKEGVSLDLFGSNKAQVVDPTERMVAVRINTDYLPKVNLEEEGSPPTYEKVGTGHAIVMYISSRELVDPVGSLSEGRPTQLR